VIKNGVDAKKLAERFSTAPKTVQLELIDSYSAWIKAGAKVGQKWIGAGIITMAIPLMWIVLSWEGAERTPPIIYAMCALGVIAGIVMFRKGARQEKAWREHNPFKTDC
jgi:hypothetical protein